MEKELVKKLVIAISIFIVAVLVILGILMVVDGIVNKDEKKEVDNSVNEFKADFRKVYEGELFKTYVYRDGHVKIVASEKLKSDLNSTNSIYAQKFESNTKKQKLLSDGVNVNFDKNDKAKNAFEYIVGENGEEKGIAFVLESGEGSLLLEDDIFKGDDFNPKKVKGLKNVDHFVNYKNINKKEKSSLNKGYNLVAVVTENNMWNVVTDKDSMENNMYVNNTAAKIPVATFEDTYYVELPNNLYLNKSGYAYFSKKPEAINLRPEFTGFDSIDENIIENVFLGGMDDSAYGTYFSTGSLIGGFNYMFVARNGNLYILPQMIMETQDGNMFVTKTVNNVVNVKDVEMYEFLEDNTRDNVTKNGIYTVVTYKNGRVQILRSENYLVN